MKLIVFRLPRSTLSHSKAVTLAVFHIPKFQKLDLPKDQFHTKDKFGLAENMFSGKRVLLKAKTVCNLCPGDSLCYHCLAPFIVEYNVWRKVCVSYWLYWPKYVGKCDISWDGKELNLNDLSTEHVTIYSFVYGTMRQCQGTISSSSEIWPRPKFMLVNKNNIFWKFYHPRPKFGTG